MLRTLLRSTLIAAAAAVTFFAVSSPASAEIHDRGFECRPYEYGNPDLFANYYLPPNCGGVEDRSTRSPARPRMGRTHLLHLPAADAA